MKFLLFLKRNVPNFFTLCNLFLGIISIIATVEGYPVWAGLFILFAAFFDFIDGLLARLLKAYSNIGKQLDSLADLVSFGLAPAFIVFSFMKSVLLISNIEADDIKFFNLIFLTVPFLIVIFSAIRLARFNIDERQTVDFIGLPTPANAIFFAWLPIILSKYDLFAYYIILQLNNLLIVTLVHSFFLVSPFPFFSFKFKSFSWKDNQVRYVFLVVSLILIIVLRLYSIPLIIWFYMLMATIRYILSRQKKLKLSD